MTLNNEQYSDLVRRLTDLNDRYDQLGQDYHKELRDYGTGEFYTSTEVHMVTRIEENPSITAVRIAEYTCRTKSAISQMLTKLEGKGLIRREKDPGNGKQQLLYVTEKGRHLSLCHKAYDEAQTALPLREMVDKFGAEAIESYLAISEHIVQFYRSQKSK